MLNDPSVQMMPEHLNCPCCEFQFEWQTKITGGMDEPLKKGLILVCSNCAAVLELGDFNFQKMSKRKLKALPDTSKSILKVTVMGVLAAKVKREQKEKSN